jgi:hypothetical protein
LTVANVLMAVQGSSAFVFANFNFFAVSASVIGLSYAGLLEWVDRRAFTMLSAVAKEMEITDAMMPNFLPDRVPIGVKPRPWPTGRSCGGKARSSPSHLCRI